MKTALSLVVLAAGIGSRFGGFKQMEPVGPSGEFLIDYSLYDALRAGFDRIVFLIRRDIEQDFKATIGARTEKRATVAYAFQELSDLPAGFSPPSGRTKPWGTGHALLACRGAVDGPFAVINADDFYGRDAYEVLARFLRDSPADESRYAMVGYRLGRTLSDHGSVARGICRIGPGGVLTSITETTGIRRADGRIQAADRDGRTQTFTGDEPVSMNLWGLKPSLFNFLADDFRRFLPSSASSPTAEFFLPDVINRLVRDRRAQVSVLETKAEWFGITHRQDLPLTAAGLRRLIQADEYPDTLLGLSTASAKRD